MFIVSEELCQNCKTLKRMLGDKIISVQFVKASENLDLCKELGIKTIPALVKDDKTVVFDLGEIVSEVEKAL
jgi:predicted thioredoxin/glutaredoxin